LHVQSTQSGGLRADDCERKSQINGDDNAGAC
jgi:hypothetical protein